MEDNYLDITIQKAWNYYMLPEENQLEKYQLDLIVIHYITLIVVIPLTI